MKKRVVCILLAAVLCVSMTACGGEKEESEHEELLQMLENGQYESAHYYIDNLKRQDAEANKEDEEKISALPEVYGEWILKTAYDEENPIESVSIEKDNTCKIGDKEYKWRVNNESETYANLYVTEGETKVYSISLNIENREPSLSLGKIIEEETGRTESIGNYRNVDNYDKIEITVDNFTEYFEFVEEVEFSKDSFGEVSSMNYRQYVVLKEQYLDKISDLSDVVVELDFTYGKKSVTVDLANQTYTLGTDFEPNTYDRDPIQGKFVLNIEDGVPVSYRLGNSSAHYSASSSQILDFRTDMQVLRVEGALYLMK